MTNNKEKSVYVFIDASNVWNVVKSERRFIEFKNLKKYFKEKFSAGEVQIFYYDAYPKDGTREYSLDGKQKITFGKVSFCRVVSIRIYLKYQDLHMRGGYPLGLLKAIIVNSK